MLRQAVPGCLCKLEALALVLKCAVGCLAQANMCVARPSDCTLFTSWSTSDSGGGRPSDRVFSLCHGANAC
jgi:hypothetical protein